MRYLYAVVLLTLLACGSPTDQSPNLQRGDNGPVGGGPGNSVQFSRSCTGYACTFTDVTTKGNYSDRRDWYANWNDSVPGGANTRRGLPGQATYLLPDGTQVILTNPVFSTTFPTCPTGHVCSYEVLLYRWATSKGVSADSVFALP